jgi:hypothetical protein
MAAPPVAKYANSGLSPHWHELLKRLVRAGTLGPVGLVRSKASN